MDLPRPYSLSINPEGLISSYAAGNRTFHWAELRGVRLVNARLNGIDLCDATLEGADLSGADLEGAELQGADLGAANLTHAKLSRANLKWANLANAKLTNADLSGAQLVGTDLRAADLRSASLVSATLADLSLVDVDVADVHLGNTRFLNTELGALCSSKCSHLDPSTIDLRTVLRSRQNPGLSAFIRRTGMAAQAAARLVMFAQNIDETALGWSTRQVFLVCHRADTALASKLHDALDQRGITTFVKRWLPATLSACGCHCVILVCSRSSLTVRWPMRGLPLPTSDGQMPPFVVVTADDYLPTAIGQLTPPALVSYARECWTALRARIAAEFAGKESRDSFNLEVDKLIVALSGWVQAQ